MRLRHAAGLALLGLLLLTGGAQAAGVGTIELEPQRGTAFHVKLGDEASTTTSMTLRNTGKEAVTARLYAASAVKTSEDGWNVGGAGSAPWIELPDQTIELAAGERRIMRFVVRQSEQKTGAVVIEQTGGTVVQRAATLVYLEPASRWSLPLVAVVAGALVILMGAAVISVRQRERIPAEYWQ